MVGAQKGNWSFVDSVDANDISNWQGNQDTMPGDIVVMYCLSPRSATHSVWRAISPGFVDPLFYYYNTIWMGRPVRLGGVKWSTIKADPVLSVMPLVKANMQGINGRALTEAQYNRLLALAEQEGVDLSKIPRLLQLEQLVTGDLVNERDIEEKLLEPLLGRLGYSPADWVRQMPLRFGRGERIYPDYVIGGDASKKGEETGDFIWEAKYRITSDRQLREAFMQANSYARHLNAHGLGLVALEGVWAATEKTGMTFDKLQHFTWATLGGSDGLRELMELTSRS